MRVLSFGAGVQSTALLLASTLGLVPPFDEVIFADTQAEPKSVYDWLAFVESKIGRAVTKVTVGNIETDLFSNGRSANPPLFTLSAAGDPGILLRQCSKEYKTEPINAALRKYKSKNPISVSLAISTDEAGRAKKSRLKWIKLEYPLLWPELSKNCGGSLGWHRQKCLDFVETHWGVKPPKSACYFCPYHSNKEWFRLKTEEPEFFEKAIVFDRKIRRRADVDADLFVHALRVPLESIDFENLVKDPNQLTFADECEGMCGV